MTADGVTIVKVNARSFSKVACIYYNKRSMSVNHFLLPNFERSPTSFHPIFIILKLIKSSSKYAFSPGAIS